MAKSLILMLKLSIKIVMRKDYMQNLLGYWDFSSNLMEVEVLEIFKNSKSRDFETFSNSVENKVFGYP